MSANSAQLGNLSLFLIFEVNIHYFQARRVGTSGHPSSVVEAKVDYLPLRHRQLLQAAAD